MRLNNEQTLFILVAIFAAILLTHSGPGIRVLAGGGLSLIGTATVLGMVSTSPLGWLTRANHGAQRARAALMAKIEIGLGVMLLLSGIVSSAAERQAARDQAASALKQAEQADAQKARLLNALPQVMVEAKSTTVIVQTLIDGKQYSKALAFADEVLTQLRAHSAVATGDVAYTSLVNNLVEQREQAARKMVEQRALDAAVWLGAHRNEVAADLERLGRLIRKRERTEASALFKALEERFAPVENVRFTSTAHPAETQSATVRAIETLRKRYAQVKLEANAANERERTAQRLVSQEQGWLTTLVEITRDPSVRPRSTEEYVAELPAKMYQYNLPPFETVMLGRREGQPDAWELRLTSQVVRANALGAERLETLVEGAAGEAAWYQVHGGPFSGVYLSVGTSELRLVNHAYLETDHWVGVRGLTAWACAEDRISEAACRRFRKGPELPTRL